MAGPASKARTGIDILKSIQRENAKQWGRATGGISTGGGSLNSTAGSPNTAITGNFLPLTGGTLTGSLSFAPILRLLDANGAIDISNEGISAGRVIVSPNGNNKTLNFINTTRRHGQILYLQGIELTQITIRNGVPIRDGAGNLVVDDNGQVRVTGNIETIHEMDVILDKDDIIQFMFDGTDNKWQQMTPTAGQLTGLITTTPQSTNYELEDLGTIGGTTRIFSLPPPMGTQGYEFRLNDDIQIVLEQDQSNAFGSTFYMVIRQDSVGGHEIIGSSANIVNASGTEINSLLNKTPNSTTIFIFTNPKGSQWHVDHFGLGTVTGGAGATDISFMDLLGQISETQIPNNEILNKHIKSLEINKLVTVPVDANHILLSGGSVIDNFWGTLDNVIGGLNSSKLTTLPSNAGTVLIANAVGKYDNMPLNLSILNDVSPGSAVPGTLFLRGLENGIPTWIYGKLSDEYIDDHTISIEKLAHSSSDVNHVVLGGVTTNSPNYFGTINQIAGFLDPTKLRTLASANAGKILRIADTGFVELDAFTFSALTDVQNASATEGNLILRARDPSDGIVKWVFGPLSNSYITDNSISIEKLSHVSADAGHAVVGGLTPNSPNTYSSINGIAGKLNLNKINTTVGNAGRYLRVGTDGNIGVETLNLSSLGDVPSSSPVAGQLFLRGIQNGITQWLYGKLSNDYINDHTISIGKLAHASADAGHAVVGGVTTNSPNTYSSINGIAGLLNINKLVTVAGNVGKFLRVTSTGAIATSTAGGTVAHLNDIGDVNVGTNPTNNAVIVRQGDSWRHSLVENSMIQSMSAAKLTGTINTARMPSVYQSALTGYNTGNGSIETRVSSLESGSGGGSGTVARLNDIQDVNVGNVPASNRVITRLGNEWRLSLVENTMIHTMSSAKLFGTISSSLIPNLSASKITSGIFDDSQIPNLDASKINDGQFPISRMPSTYQGALSGYQISEGTVERRFDRLESATSTVNRLNDIGDVSVGTNPSNNRVLVRQGSLWRQSMVENSMIRSVSAAKLTGSISAGQISGSRFSGFSPQGILFLNTGTTSASSIVTVINGIIDQLLFLNLIRKGNSIG